MKPSIYLNCTSRSLMRGGQRTILAIFCIAVGVMAIVSLQLVGLMINNAFTANVRDANGGDIAVTSNTKPFVQSDLPSFARLKSEGIISSYTALANADGSVSGAAAAGRAFTIEAVDTHSFPVVTAPTFKDPASGTIEALLANNGVIVDSIFADRYNKKVGDEIDIHAGQQNQNPRLLRVLSPIRVRLRSPAACYSFPSRTTRLPLPVPPYIMIRLTERPPTRRIL